MIINRKNNHRYVGQSINIKHRWRSHLIGLRQNRHINRHLQNSYNFYGEKEFHFIIIELCTRNKLNERENFWIEKLKPEYNAFKLLYEKYKRISTRLDLLYLSSCLDCCIPFIPNVDGASNFLCPVCKALADLEPDQREEMKEYISTCRGFFKPFGKELLPRQRSTWGYQDERT